VIYSVDRDGSALRQQQQAMRQQYPDLTVHYRSADFTQKLDLPPLDGLIMANSLHFHRENDSILKRTHGYLKSGGQLVLVEYNTDSGNTWVPFPISFTTWESLARRSGFAGTRLLAKRPSRFLGEIYSAASHT
jgi:hypothetical protein